MHDATEGILRDSETIENLSRELAEFADSNERQAQRVAVLEDSYTKAEQDIEALLKEHWGYHSLNAEEREGVAKPDLQIREAILAVLDETQRPAYEEHLKRMDLSKYQTIDIAKLGEYPTTFEFTENQKDKVYSNIFNVLENRKIQHEYMSFVFEFNQINKSDHHPHDLMLL